MSDYFDVRDPKQLDEVSFALVSGMLRGMADSQRVDPAVRERIRAVVAAADEAILACARETWATLPPELQRNATKNMEQALGPATWKVLALLEQKPTEPAPQ